MGEAGGFTSTFVIEHLFIHGGGDAGEEVPTTPATEPSTPRAVPSTPGVVPSSPGVVPTTLGQVPNAPIAEPRGLAVVPTTPRLVPSTPAVVPTSPGVVTVSACSPLVGFGELNDNTIKYLISLLSIEQENEFIAYTYEL